MNKLIYFFIFLFISNCSINKVEKSHGIHFLKGRGWTEESLLEAVRNHYHMYDLEVEESDPEPDPTENDKK